MDFSTMHDMHCMYTLCNYVVDHAWLVTIGYDGYAEYIQL